MRILRYVAVVLVSVTLTYFATLEGCKKEKIVREVVVLRDSADQRVIDSLIKRNAVLRFNQEKLKKGIDLVRSEQKFSKKILKQKYEDIKKSDIDTTYNDVRQYLREWKPEE